MGKEPSSSKATSRHTPGIDPRTYAELDRFFSISLDMMCIASSDGFFKRVSPAFTETLGWSSEELTTLPFISFVHPDDVDATMREVERQVASGEQVLNFENRYRHKDGSWRTLAWKSVPHSDGQMYAIARDVSDERAAAAHTAMLYEELKQRATELEAAQKTAELASRAKSEFLSRMSHELRTPLNAVIGYGQLLELRSTDAKTTESVQAILKGGRHLLDLINEILDLSRIETGKLSISLESVQLAGVIEQALGLVRPSATLRDVRLEFEAPPEGDLHALADRQRLVQALLNLLSNAVKFNHVGGSVTIRVLETGDKHRIEVADTGRGIDPECVGSLFLPFQRMVDDPVEGTGLGLALSKNLLELMGGTMELASTSPDGSVFAMEIQRAAAPIATGFAGGDTTLRGLPKLADGLRVVYVEDNLANLRLLESIFSETSSIELLSAMQASEGIRLIEGHLPDVVLLDMHLPDAHGIKVLHSMRQNEATVDIPVIVLSADGTSSQMKHVLSAGAQAYLMKPLDIRLLFNELASIRPQRRKAA